MLVALVIAAIIAVVITGMTAVGFFMRANEARRAGDAAARRYVWYGILFSLPTVLMVFAASAYPGIVMMQHHHH